VSDHYDLVIVGSGAAGLTAGIYAARDRCRALLVERFSPGGQVLNCEHIENFPGFLDGVAGYTLGPLMQQQATHGLELQMTEVDYPGLTANTGFSLRRDRTAARALRRGGGRRAGRHRARRAQPGGRWRLTRRAQPSRSITRDAG
jgi:thioredoxin reductase